MEDSSDYERQRQENIARNKALLKQLQLDSLSASLTAGLKKSSPKPSSRSSTPRVKKERNTESSPAPRRTSSRLAGLPADSTIAKRKAEDESRALEEAERAKRSRVAGDLSFEIKQGLLNGVGKYERTFTNEDVKNTGDKSLREVRERMMGLKLWDRFEPTELKITPERIYHLEFHPTTEKKLIFAGDKVGNLGILNASDSDSNETPDISTYKLHARTISSFFIPPSSPSSLITSSYDSTIRRFDLNSGKSVELFVHPDEEAFSSVNPLDDECRVLLYSTLDGQVGQYDTRDKKPAVTWSCSEKKIGGCHVLPTNRNFIATASLDRTVKIWDLRNMVDPVGSHDSRLSVSAAMWSSTGKLATTSYDDTVKIYNPTSLLQEKRKGELEPEFVVKHNNQTGRWVTILRAVWQESPEDGVQKLVIANMNRGIDVFGDDGEYLAQLADNEKVSAVPAVARAHPSRSWIAGGTGSGKVVLYV
ncbi:WD40 repeat-like protein [Wilcoxina mikolae CBS 423.85]|nr:WD40 repeat-like protein [Wilcoxina mikolae CBS 423.85]